MRKKVLLRDGNLQFFLLLLLRSPPSPPPPKFPVFWMSLCLEGPWMIKDVSFLLFWGVVEMAQMVCGSCRRLLSYPRGTKHVKCSCCQTVNLVLEGYCFLCLFNSLTVESWWMFLLVSILYSSSLLLKSFISYVKFWAWYGRFIQSGEIRMMFGSLVHYNCSLIDHLPDLWFFIWLVLLLWVRMCDHYSTTPLQLLQ